MYYSIEDDDANINIKSNEGDIISVPFSNARNSGLLRKIIGSTKYKYGEEPETEINLETDILVKITEYLEKYESNYPQGIERPLKSSDFKECVENWDYKFINEEVDKICKILNGADMLDIPSLVDLAASKLASILKEKSSDELKQNLSIPVDDFTPRDKEEIKKDVDWCIDNY
ncbi:MAG: hypothetical protein MJ252_22380 [archaeon]|nr:hypothetical protein [archaeon]